MSRRQHAQKREAERSRKMVEAAKLRAAGASYRAIGDALGIDFGYARTLVLRALEEAPYEAADVMRTQEGQRLDRLQQALWPDALRGDTTAVNSIIRIMERRARLFGLDPPTRVESDVTVTSGLDAEVARLAAMLEPTGDGP